MSSRGAGIKVEVCGAAGTRKCRRVGDVVVFQKQNGDVIKVVVKVLKTMLLMPL